MPIRSLLTCACCLAILHPAPLLSGELRGEAKGDLCIVEGKLDPKTMILVRIESSPGRPFTPEEQENLDQDAAWRRGRYQNWSQVTRVVIQVNGEAVLIPDSAFDGIYGVSHIRVFRKHGNICFHVTGGDAGESYDAFFTLRASPRVKGHYQMAERVWRHGEFSDEVWEKTTYHNTIWDDPRM